MERRPSVSEKAAQGQGNNSGQTMVGDGINQRGKYRGRGSGRGGVVGIGRGRGRPSDSDRGRGRGRRSDNQSAEVEEEIMIEKPIYSCKVNELRPGTMGHTLTVKVLNSTPISTAALPVAECLVGDDSAVILFTARGSQVHQMKPGTTVVLRNARVTIFKGSMRLSVSVERPHIGNVETKPIQFVKLPPDSDFHVNTDNNLSVIEFEVITLQSMRHEEL